MSYKLSHLAPCFYHEGIYPLFLARVDEESALSDSAHSGGAAADAVVPVALHRSWVRLDSEALVLVVFGDPTGSYLVVRPRAARAC